MFFPKFPSQSLSSSYSSSSSPSSLAAAAVSSAWSFIDSISMIRERALSGYLAAFSSSVSHPSPPPSLGREGLEQLLYHIRMRLITLVVGTRSGTYSFISRRRDSSRSSAQVVIMVVLVVVVETGPLLLVLLNHNFHCIVLP